MPVAIKKLPDGSYSVVEMVAPYRVYAKHTTLSKALAQMRLLNAIHHGFVPKAIRVKPMKKK